MSVDDEPAHAAPACASASGVCTVIMWLGSCFETS
jgi:hypothetical protein